jgi:hypothetical protein
MPARYPKRSQFNKKEGREISGFRRGVVEVFALLGYCAAYVGSYLPTFRDSLSVPSSRVKQSNNYKHTLRNIPEERRPEKEGPLRTAFT